ncbi:uncharacterized protein LOC142764862 [Rhipicephalus microplus]|uniref:uncharacterized protein LOC142764862 n=1 Tax=Rhipicephalus microplus TaxID=6941 RepID=UPI003F6B62C6
MKRVEVTGRHLTSGGDCCPVPASSRALGHPQRLLEHIPADSFRPPLKRIGWKRLDGTGGPASSARWLRPGWCRDHSLGDVPGLLDGQGMISLSISPWLHSC